MSIEPIIPSFFGVTPPGRVSPVVVVDRVKEFGLVRYRLLERAGRVGGSGWVAWSSITRECGYNSATDVKDLFMGLVGDGFMDERSGRYRISERGRAFLEAFSGEIGSFSQDFGDYF